MKDQKRFCDQVKVVESCCGVICPTLVADNETTEEADEDESTSNEKKSRDKSSVCTFSNGADKKMFGECIDGFEQ